LPSNSGRRKVCEEKRRKEREEKRSGPAAHMPPRCGPSPMGGGSGGRWWCVRDGGCRGTGTYVDNDAQVAHVIPLRLQDFVGDVVPSRHVGAWSRRCAPPHTRGDDVTHDDGQAPKTP
jgi:hypothetical protein